MRKLRSAIRRFFAHLTGFRKPVTPGAVVCKRLQELRREQSCCWEIVPTSVSELSFGTELGMFPAGRVKEQAASRIKISVNRLR
jgi:hypothetical protein